MLTRGNKNGVVEAQRADMAGQLRQPAPNRVMPIDEVRPYTRAEYTYASNNNLVFRDGTLRRETEWICMIARQHERVLMVRKEAVRFFKRWSRTEILWFELHAYV